MLKIAQLFFLQASHCLKSITILFSGSYSFQKYICCLPLLQQKLSYKPKHIRKPFVYIVRKGFDDVSKPVMTSQSSDDLTNFIFILCMSILVFRLFLGQY